VVDGVRRRPARTRRWPTSVIDRKREKLEVERERFLALVAEQTAE
jgi:hypothetical protein